MDVYIKPYQTQEAGKSFAAQGSKQPRWVFFTSKAPKKLGPIEIVIEIEWPMAILIDFDLD